jgi:hypothetical protein
LQVRNQAHQPEGREPWAGSHSQQRFSGSDDLDEQPEVVLSCPRGAEREFGGAPRCSLARRAQTSKATKRPVLERPAEDDSGCPDPYLPPPASAGQDVDQREEGDDDHRSDATMALVDAARIMRTSFPSGQFA